MGTYLVSDGCLLGLQYTKEGGRKHPLNTNMLLLLGLIFLQISKVMRFSGDLFMKWGFLQKYGGIYLLFKKILLIFTGYLYLTVRLCIKNEPGININSDYT